ncbi:hypothetical protein PILCRDRAFT_814877 [Piloderma croceum F 1598]|uniref:Uncharacterized protein n=1 Tax=Piloderma croceum (strain F 1598) TaxID=765440 RepID=A0A0C3FT30_PILCF|nr:hypothetical protein PILCRDRAFT_814877 [Piloderma croceum F 1598]
MRRRDQKIIRQYFFLSPQGIRTGLKVIHPSKTVEKWRGNRNNTHDDTHGGGRTG